jgi:hypothetical protein
MARHAGIIKYFHGMTDDDLQTCFVLNHVPSKETMDKFFEKSGKDIAKSGHILESTEVAIVNQLIDGGDSA